jgi:hypothetical protein
MYDNLIEKIKTELKKSGYPLEFYCKHVLWSKRWSISGAKQFVTGDGLYKEIDIEGCEGFFSDSRSKSEYHIVTHIPVECKKNSKNPWVFFMDRISRNPNLSCVDSDLRMLTRMELSGKAFHYMRNENGCSSYVVAFKDDSSKESQQIYEAVHKVIEFVKFSIEDWTKAKGRRNTARKLPINIHVYYPVVVFDGQLFVAEVANEDLILREASHVVLERSEVLDVHGIWHYTVDIVRKDYFPQYLDLLRQNEDILKSAIEKSMKKKNSEKRGKNNPVNPPKQPSPSKRP